MYKPKDIYAKYRKAQSAYMKRGWRMPKDWNSFLEKMSFSNQKNLLKITTNFNTVWLNVDPELYFEIGFSMFGKSFSYHRFFDRRIMNLYKDKARINRMKEEDAEEKVKESINFITKFIKEKDLKNLREYIRCVSLGTGLIPTILIHWRKKKIDPYTLIFLMKRYKAEFNNYEDDILEHYIGSDFLSNQYRWRLRLLENEKIKKLLRKEIPKLEKN